MKKKDIIIKYYMIIDNVLGGFEITQDDNKRAINTMNSVKTT